MRRLRAINATLTRDAPRQVTKKMTSKLKQLEEDVTRMQASMNTNAHVKSAIEQLLSRM